MDLADVTQANGKPLPHLTVDCVGNSFANNGVFITSMRFDKAFTKIILKGFIEDSSSSSSDSSANGNTSKSEVASGSSSSDSDVEFVFVLNRQPAARKSAFENFWAK